MLYYLTLVGDNSSSICIELVSPKNGDVTISGTSEEDTAVYTCDKGFELRGIEMRVCQSTGVWSGSEPVCSSKKPQPYILQVALLIMELC